MMKMLDKSLLMADKSLV